MMCRLHYRPDQTTAHTLITDTRHCRSLTRPKVISTLVNVLWQSPSATLDGLANSLLLASQMWAEHNSVHYQAAVPNTNKNGVTGEWSAVLATEC